LQAQEARGPLPGEEREWNTTEDSISVVSEEGTADEGEATDTDEDESVSSRESTSEGEESTSEGEESTSEGEQSTSEGESRQARRGVDERSGGVGERGRELTANGVESTAATQGLQGKYCHTCNKKFTRLSDLKRHLESSQAHGGSSQVCKRCGAVLARGDGLRRHLQICPAIKAAHDDKPYDRTVKRRGRPTLRGTVDIQDEGSTAGQASGSRTARTAKTAPRSQRATQPLVGEDEPPRQCKRV